ncbi:MULTISPECIES: ABC transporter substrate-binding protein [unclassified Rhizobium]|uniref:ABC transporter substrate-binding protein n=1 Tax=Rhizobium sp. PP-CC-3G-465 TaxID=2135648 RepID=UPI000D878113|nr:ABC-type nitrate/sulfonate/bicarbonate transport system substrate-binding protein [Rhizobium sp. PP-WC-1G-195]TCP82751.1 ABC-type nitrate/sulfonate/bicarbonate transport system substrate-binding protein [Rhizobium sp. PP-CC-2G-626]TCQ20091.1 ABC-type nitrate/sulfonate/bicarbonate transport system substrate-binding protein [Rhizobium sp. PP-CC-3G-465]
MIFPATIRPTMTRRTVLASLAGLGLSALSARAKTLKTVTVALDWTPNTNHIGLFVAREKGFYRDAGINVEILPYSDTSAATLVANHVADFGIVGSIGLFTQHTAGADLVATYAVVQTETGRLVFKGDRADIKRPRDLDGLIYGGFGSDWENALIGAMIRHDGGKGTFETITLGTSAYQALENGAVDFTLEVYTWEGVKAELEGIRQGAFRYADYGAPDQHTTLIGSSGTFLRNRPLDAKAFTQATLKGYDFAVDYPDEAVDLMIAANSDALTDRRLVRASLQALIDGQYFRTSTGVVGRIDPVKMESIGNYLFEADILKDINGKPVAEKPEFSGYFTTEPLQAE